MSISIEYLNNLSYKNNNIVIFVSKLSQLKSLNLPFDLQKHLNNKDFVNRINKTLYAEINNHNTLFDSIVNIKICLVKLNQNYLIETGAMVCDKFKFKFDKNITFVFASLFFSKYRLFCSDIIFGFLLKKYNFNKYLNTNRSHLGDILLNLYKFKPFKELKYKTNLLYSVNYCKDLVSEPSNILNPVSYAKKCIDLKKIGLKVKILDLNQLQKIGMNALLGVSSGSFNEPRVVIFEWNLNKNKKPSILVGKGVTFDTGGISLKPASGMEEMIFDMGGSAVVVGSMINAALNKYNQPLVGIIGLVENMPDGKAQRPGDIVNSLSGQTIEVLNTDAEGRLVLADIITYVQKKYNPKQIIDFATLTGAIMIALGTHRAGLFSNNNNLSQKLFKAGETTGEKVWRLPLGNEYDDEMNSNRADIKNIGSTRYGGSIQAAQFIQRFIKKEIPWAHLDIAGVTWSMKSNKNSFTKLHSPGATAFGVRLMDQFLNGK